MGVAAASAMACTTFEAVSAGVSIFPQRGTEGVAAIRRLHGVSALWMCVAADDCRWLLQMLGRCSCAVFLVRCYEDAIPMDFLC